MNIDVIADDDGTEFDAGDLGTAWLPFTEPRAQDLERLALALLQHAATMPQGDHTTISADEVLTTALLNLYSKVKIIPCGELPRTWGARRSRDDT